MKKTAKGKRGRPAGPSWTWNRTKEEAARLLVDGSGPAEVARQLQVGSTTVDRWKQIPQFIARMEEFRTAYRAKLLEALPERLQTKQGPLLELGRKYANIEREIEARAENFRSRGLKHGSTGLVVESFKSAGSGDNAQLEAEYAIDTQTIRAANATLEQISKELGQYDEFRKGDRPPVVVQNNNTQVNLSVLSDDELAAYRALLAKLAAGGNPALGPGSGDTPTA